LDSHKIELKTMGHELIATQKKNEECQIIKKTQQCNDASFAVETVNQVEIQTDKERRDDDSMTNAPVSISSKEKVLIMAAKREDGQKLEESSRYATSVGVRRCN
jgi:hypothetical protein